MNDVDEHRRKAALHAKMVEEVTAGVSDLLQRTEPHWSARKVDFHHVEGARYRLEVDFDLQPVELTDLLDSMRR